MVYNHKVNAYQERYIGLGIVKSLPSTPKRRFIYKKSQKDQITVEISWKIVLKGIKNQIAFNIIDLEDLKKMWDKLENIYSKIGQKIVYLIL